MLQGYRAASPQACGTRGGARAAGRPPLRWVMPGIFPAGPQVLPEWRARCVPRRGRLAARAGGNCPPSLQAWALGGGRISSEPPLRRSTPRLAALDLHNQKHSSGDAVGVSTLRWHLYFKSCDVWRWEGSLVWYRFVSRRFLTWGISKNDRKLSSKADTQQFLTVEPWLTVEHWQRTLGAV